MDEAVGASGEKEGGTSSEGSKPVGDTKESVKGSPVLDTNISNQGKPESSVEKDVTGDTKVEPSSKKNRKEKSIASLDSKDAVSSAKPTVTSSSAATPPSSSPVTLGDNGADSGKKHEQALSALKQKYSASLKETNARHKLEMAALEDKMKGIEVKATDALEAAKKQQSDALTRAVEEALSNASQEARQAQSVLEERLKAHATKEKEGLTKKLKAAEERHATAMASFKTEYESKISNLTNQLSRTRVELEAANKAVAEEKSNNDAASSDGRDSTTDDKKTSEHILALEKQLKDIQEAKEHCDLTIVELNVKVEQLEHQITSKNTDIAEHADQLSERDAAIAALQGDLRSVEESLAKKAAESKANVHSIQDKDTTIAALNVDILKLKETVADRERALETAATNLAAAQSSMEQSEEDADKIQTLMTRIEQLTTENASYDAAAKEKDALLAKGASDQEAIASLTGEIKTLRANLSERDNALQSSNKQLAEVQKQLQDASKRVSDLQAEISEKDKLQRKMQSSVVAEDELRRQLAAAEESVNKSNERLAAFEKEGQHLAKKQSEMEKVVRKSKADLREKDAEITKLKDSKEQLVKAIEQTQDVLKKHELDNANASKSLSAMQAVSQASSGKLMKLEAELASKAEEIASQKRALETSWADANELKRSIAEMKAERDELRRRIGEGTSRVMETESSRRDIEQREAVLRATNQQLQDSLQRQMQETVGREERLRDEVNEMRKRWQEAVGSREAMASELSSATAPLLRQISSLQESMRLKSEHWQNIESSLSERALRAENAAETAEHKRNLADEQLATLKQQLSIASAKLEQSQAQLTTAEHVSDRLKKREAVWSEEKADLESRLSLETAQRQSLQSTLRELEIRQKIEIQDAQDAAKLQLTQKEQELSNLRKEIAYLKEQANGYHNLSKHGGASSPGGSSSSSHSVSSGGNRNSGRFNSRNRQLQNQSSGGGGGSSSTGGNTSSGNMVDGDAYVEDVDIDSGTGGAVVMGSGLNAALIPGSLPNGELSFAAAEKMQQRSQLRDDDMRALNAQIQQLESTRNALLEEVSYLSMQNSQLEEETEALPQLRQDFENASKQNELLLVLLGEKDEELEAMVSDMQEVKLLYQSHMEELIEGKVGTATGSSLQTNNSIINDNNNSSSNSNSSGSKGSKSSASEKRLDLAVTTPQQQGRQRPAGIAASGSFSAADSDAASASAIVNSLSSSLSTPALGSSQ